MIRSNGDPFRGRIIVVAEDPVQVRLTWLFGVDPQVQLFTDIFQRLESLLVLFEVLLPGIGH